jgi:hypothetical protein
VCPGRLDLVAGWTDHIWGTGAAFRGSLLESTLASGTWAGHSPLSSLLLLSSGENPMHRDYDVAQGHP